MIVKFLFQKAPFVCARTRTRAIEHTHYYGNIYYSRKQFQLLYYLYTTRARARAFSYYDFMQVHTSVCKCIQVYASAYKTYALAFEIENQIEKTAYVFLFELFVFL